MGVKLGLSYEVKNRLRVFENRVLGGISEPKRGEVAGDWMRLHMRSSIVWSHHQMFFGCQSFLYTNLCTRVLL
jgi:hypothetical protein